MIAGRCIFADKFADILFAFDFPEDEEGEDDAGAEEVVEDDDYLVELYVPCLRQLFFQGH